MNVMQSPIDFSTPDIAVRPGLLEVQPEVRTSPFDQQERQVKVLPLLASHIRSTVVGSGIETIVPDRTAIVPTSADTAESTDTQAMSVPGKIGRAHV